jgi:SAM-dependent methyltransferase
MAMSTLRPNSPSQPSGEFRPPEYRCVECHAYLRDVRLDKLVCGCGMEYPVVAEVPWLLPAPLLHQFTGSRAASGSAEAIASKTASVYGLGWSMPSDYESVATTACTHFDMIRDVVPFDFVRGKDLTTRVGLDGGSGGGRDTDRIARMYPDVMLYSLDLSEGVYSTQRRTKGLSNVRLIRASILDIPLPDQSMDFVYSYGVLHHTADPEKGFRELTRVARVGAPVVIYVYEDFEDYTLKRWGVAAETLLRKRTLRMSPQRLMRCCRIASPFVFAAFTVPARLLRSVGLGRVADQVPWNFCPGPRGVADALYDRLGAPMQARYSEGDLRAWYADAFREFGVSRIPNAAGLVAWGVRV